LPKVVCKAQHIWHNTQKAFGEEKNQKTGQTIEKTNMHFVLQALGLQPISTSVCQTPSQQFKK